MTFVCIKLQSYSSSILSREIAVNEPNLEEVDFNLVVFGRRGDVHTL